MGVRGWFCAWFSTPFPRFSINFRTPRGPFLEHFQNSDSSSFLEFGDGLAHDFQNPFRHVCTFQDSHRHASRCKCKTRNFLAFFVGVFSAMVSAGLVTLICLAKSATLALQCDSCACFGFLLGVSPWECTREIARMVLSHCLRLGTKEMREQARWCGRDESRQRREIWTEEQRKGKWQRKHVSVTRPQF